MKNKNIKCSFCNTQFDKLELIIHVNDEVFICRDCVLKCLTIITNYQKMKDEEDEKIIQKRRQKEVFKEDYINNDNLFDKFIENEYSVISLFDKLIEAEKRIKELENIQNKIIDIVVNYGSYDGSHHKQYALNQIIKEIMGNNYNKWVKEYESGEDGPKTYEWDEGTP